MARLLRRDHSDRLDAFDGIERAWHRRRQPGPATTEWFLVAAPAGAAVKEGPRFPAAWV